MSMACWVEGSCVSVSSLQTGDTYMVTPPVMLSWVPAQCLRLCEILFLKSAFARRDGSCSLLFCHWIRVAARGYSSQRCRVDPHISKVSFAEGKWNWFTCSAFYSLFCNSFWNAGKFGFGITLEMCRLLHKKIQNYLSLQIIFLSFFFACFPVMWVSVA